MKSVDIGVLSKSECFSITPSDTSRELFLYPTWYGHYYCSNNYYMKRDWYPHLLLLYVCKGAIHVEYEGDSVDLTEGELFLMDCTSPHYYQAQDGLEFLYVHFNGSNAHALCRHIIQKNGWVFRSRNNDAVFQLLQKAVQDYSSDCFISDFDNSMLLYQMLQLLYNSQQSPKKEITPVETAIHYIRKNFREPISLTELASQVGFSPSYFSHQFKKQTGFSPIDFVINTRMEHARELLLLTNMSVEEIALETGYASSASFINLFVKRHGESPTIYRRKRVMLQ